MLALDADGLSLFWHRTLDYQFGRVTPMAIWTLPSYHPGWPNHLAPARAPVPVAIGIVLLAVFPRVTKDPVAVAAIGAAAVIGLQITASYWFYPYVCWWLPLVLAGCSCRARSPTRPEPPVSGCRAAGTPRSRSRARPRRTR